MALAALADLCKTTFAIFSRMNRFIYGAGRLHHLPTARQRQRALDLAFDVGFRAFDVAPAYGNGINELEVGLALRGKRERCEINTKYGIPIEMYGPWARHFFIVRKLAEKVSGSSTNAYRKRDFSAAEIERCLEQSLLRLKTDYIDTFFVHEPISQMSHNQVAEIFESGAQMKKKGKIRALGIAGPIDSLRLCPSIEIFDVVQMPFADFKSDDEIIVGKKLILYGTYQAFKAGTCTNSFPRFVRGSLGCHAEVGAIVSSKSLKTISSFRELFL